VQRTRLERRARPATNKAMLGMLLLCAVGWVGLFMFERSLEPSRPAAPVVSAELETLSTEPAAPTGRGVVTDSNERGQIGDALLWLGHHSLEELRLTAPPRDNAYYYFSRLAMLDPGNREAANGLKKIAAQFAVLAEREIVNDDYQKALAMIRIGRQIDPDNEALKVLKDLAEKPKLGFWNAFASLFK